MTSNSGTDNVSSRTTHFQGWIKLLPILQGPFRVPVSIFQGPFRVTVTKYGNLTLAFVDRLLLLSNSCDKGSLHVQVVKDFHNQVEELYQRVQEFGDL